MNVRTDLRSLPTRADTTVSVLGIAVVPGAILVSIRGWRIYRIEDAGWGADG